MQPDDLALLKRVAETAKLYFKDTQRFDRAMEDDGDDAPEMQVIGEAWRQ
ncbi:MAG: hypothetical protein Q8O38_13600 [Sulfurimicrobium sp.]|nr:hypothetical protein [Sulfurimicrobium sp.]